MGMAWHGGICGMAAPTSTTAGITQQRDDGRGGKNGTRIKRKRTQRHSLPLVYLAIRHCPRPEASVWTVQTRRDCRCRRRLIRAPAQGSPPGKEEETVK